ncbi:MAG: acetyl/propionyl/methylcrotonyl-CoA carboxylase subunit alpha [Alphaproteobacteria bacterium]|nr:acetyl/propionyl/methylcrotonyl-CoA carboxylase subunit alpha [Alphaproteobacteria bacterium]
MFSKILIANRGEIACRVIRTARRMGIATVAVYSEADANALHVAMADEARLIGPPPARDSYLNIAAVIEAARQSGAEAIHPGYGFLSENADFAEACANAGLVFIGPPAEAIRAMGSKAAAKSLMQAHGVLVVPGYHGDAQDAAALAAEAERIGYPVLIKASAGGGGRGMRIVTRADEFARALVGAKREAAGAFGDDRVLLERYLERPRHIEVQVFGDRHGNIVHLWERDCSIQRRHQKIVEEAPAPGLGKTQRKKFGETAVAAARAVGYVGAGTVEFIAERDAKHFYFMEMNTRLQVEHPVTEAITGTDLVEWQIRVAAGEELPLQQNEVARHGHAIEVRLYAENPERGFLPATGTLHGLHFPETDLARVDTGVRQGDAVTPFYDPMIAKIIAWGEDREAARARLQRALADTAILGVATNLGFLYRVAANPDFAEGKVDTGFIERHREALLPAARSMPHVALAAAALWRLTKPNTAAGSDRFSPWARPNGWQLNLVPAPVSLHLRFGMEEVAIEAMATGDGWRLRFGDVDQQATAERMPNERLSVTLDGARSTVRILEHGNELAVFLDGESWPFTAIDPLARPAGADTSGGRLTAPMPGRVIQLLVAPGETVRRGQAMMVIEAMKMEHTIAAPRDGVVEAVNYAAGDPVEEGVELIALAAETSG